LNQRETGASRSVGDILLRNGFTSVNNCQSNEK